MKAEEYALILDSLFEIQIKGIKEWLDKEDPNFSENYSFNEGIAEGLNIARTAIEKSKFLFDRD